MNKRTIRNGLLLTLAAASASLEAPRIAHQPLSIETAEFGASRAIDHAVEQVSANGGRSHLGFDTNIYPGDRAMAAWKSAGDYEWVGYYLPGACHKDTSWSGTRSRLTANGWGLAIIYVGQQTWRHRLPNPKSERTRSARAKRAKKRRRHTKRRPIGTMTRKSTKPIANSGDGCSASLVSAAQGAIDAHDAVIKAEREGFPAGSVVFLDVEYMESIPKPIRDYYRAWTSAVLASGQYRPGIYAHTRNAAAIYDDISDVYAQAGAKGDPPFWIAGSVGFSPGRLPTDVGHAFASAWQGLLDVVRTVNGVELPIDISVASMNSPSRAVR